MITLALSKGRIFDDTLPLLKAVGIDVDPAVLDSRKLILPTNRADVQVVLAAGATPLSPARAAQLGATVWQGDDGQLVAALRVLTARP